MALTTTQSSPTPSLPSSNSKSTKNMSKDAQLQMEQDLWLQKKPRFLTCKEAMDRILWDPELSDVYPNLSMIYKDRFEGDTFITYEEFLNSDLAEELPQHRIQQLIYCEEIVFWDKRNRIDMLSNNALLTLIQERIQRVEREGKAFEMSNVLEPSQPSKKPQKKNKKIMKEFNRQQTEAQHKIDSTSFDDDFERYMDDYDREYGSFSSYGY